MLLFGSGVVAIAVKFCRDIIPLTDLKTNPGRVIRQVADSRRPVLLTSRGRGVAVVQSVADYEVAEEEREFMRAVVQGMADVEAGREVSVELDAPSVGSYIAGVAMTEAVRTERAVAPEGRRTERPAFPGCMPVHLPSAQLDGFEGRLEYWEAATATAWVCEPTSPYHERPSRRLTMLAATIARVRGSPIECYGSMDLLLRDERGEPQRIMQADESVYLHPAHARLSRTAMVVGKDDAPDVVLEVDHTTDARRGKLPLYESWGFAEVWVDVPDEPSPSRPRGRRPGLTIHLLEHGSYRISAESRAFPGWRADEIHAALNEPEPSARTSAVLERVGGALGVREGTGPDDDPLLRSQRLQAFERGFADGRTEGVQAARATMVRQILLSRGVEVSEGFPADAAAFAAVPEAVLTSAALTCTSEADFLASLPGRP